MHWVWTAVSKATAGLLFTRARARSGIFLTFDDGPHPEHTPRLLKLLERHDVRATFFLIGSRVEQHGAVVRAIVAAGHAIGNHSYSHPSFPAIPMRTQREEMDRTELLLSKYDGRRRHLVRPPHGRLNLSTILLCFMRRRRIALWNRDSQDYRLSREEVVQRMSSLPVRGGDVLLFHDDGGAGIDALEKLLPQWREAGLRFSAL
jgi:peptidoglycan/xylan/chitin deacetylase (PgdA/CDA1 family)